MLLRRTLPLIVWAALIFIGSSFSNPPDVSGDEWQSNLAHFTEYLVLAVLLCRFISGYRSTGSLPAIMSIAWLIAVAYGISDEYHQSFVPYRDSNIIDVLWDGSGALIGVVAYALATWQLRKRRAPATAP